MLEYVEHARLLAVWCSYKTINHLRIESAAVSRCYFIHIFKTVSYIFDMNIKPSFPAKNSVYEEFPTQSIFYAFLRKHPKAPSVLVSLHMYIKSAVWYFEIRISSIRSLTFPMNLITVSPIRILRAFANCNYGSVFPFICRVFLWNNPCPRFNSNYISACFL